MTFRINQLRLDLQAQRGKTISWLEVGRAAKINSNTLYSLASNSQRRVDLDTLERLVAFFRSQGMSISTGDLFETEPDLAPRPRRRYNPSRGGHAPGYLRDAFQEWLDEDDAPDWVEIDGEKHPVDYLLGKLWNSTDVLPASYCQNLDIPQGSTYAQAARKIKADRGGEPLGELPTDA